MKDSDVQTLINTILNNLFEIINTIFIVSVLVLNFLNLIPTSISITAIIFSISSLLIKWLVINYLNFILSVRDNGFIKDNRAAHFLAFDAQKFVLIILALVIVLVLGINKVLNNETIATLLGGLIGSLLTMKGSFFDLKFTKEEREAINNTITRKK